MKPEELQLKILEWKKKYESVYQINLIDQEQEFCYMFIYRNIGREEYKEILFQELDPGEVQELICQTCVLYPEEYDFSVGLAGIAEVVANSIIDSSGLNIGQAKELLDRYREEMNIFDYQADCIIHEAFPQYSLEEIQNWSIQKSMYYLSRAEWILQNLRGLQIITLDDQVQQQMQTQNYQYSFTNESNPQNPTNSPSFSTESNKDGELSEAEVMAMLAENEAKHGRTINNQTTDLTKEIFPELNWFRAEEELKGDFD